MPTIKEIQALISKRDILIQSIIDVLENKIDLAQRALLELVVSDVVDKLEKDDDTIKNTAANRAKLLLFERIYNQYAKKEGLQVVAAVADGVTKILDFNKGYFQLISEDVDVVPLSNQVKDTIQKWLGLTTRNTVAKDGYLDSLISDPTTKQKVKDLLLNATITQKGFYETRSNLKELIQGTSEKVGLIETRYSQVVHDQMSVIDRTISKQYADKLKLKYYLYAGGLVKDSRPFCIQHNGKVFTNEEVSEFDPPSAKPPAYEPFTMLGGYNCRHSLNPISKTVAENLRPDLKDNPD